MKSSHKLKNERSKYIEAIEQPFIIIDLKFFIKMNFKARWNKERGKRMKKGRGGKVMRWGSEKWVVRIYYRHRRRKDLPKSNIQEMHEAKKPETSRGSTGRGEGEHEHSIGSLSQFLVTCYATLLATFWSVRPSVRQKVV